MADTVAIAFPLPPNGYAENAKIKVNLDAIVTGINNISNGLTNFNQLNVGTASTSNGIMNWYNSTNGFYYQIKPTTAPTANRIYSFDDIGVDGNFVLTAGSQSIAGSKTFTGNLAFTFSLNNANNYFQIINQNTGSSSGAGIFIEVATASTGDPVVQFNNGSGAQYWTTGMDNSDSQKYKISASSALGTTDEFVLTTAGNGTFTGSLTATTGAFSATTNQFVLGATRTVTITAPTPATSSRTHTIPDITGNGTFAFLEGTQTFSGTKTFSAAPVISALTASTVPYLDASKILTSSAVTPTELGYVSGVTSAIQTQFAAKAPLASPTFTGTVTYPTPFTLGAVSVTATGTELNYSVGVTSAIQTQINTKATDTLVVHLAGSETITGTKTMQKGTSDATLYQNFFLAAGGGGSAAGVEVNSYTQTAITTAKNIYQRDAGCAVVFVHGSDGAGNDFMDEIFANNVSGGTVTVLHSLTSKGSPTARTYTQSGLNLQLAMAAGTYTTRVLAFDMAVR